MQTQTKAQLAQVTLSLLTAVAFVFLLGIVVLVLCAGLSLNPFKEMTTAFLVSSFTGLIGVSAILVLLNVAANMSVIADAKLAELKMATNEKSRIFVRKLVALFVLIALGLVGLVVAGTFFSKEKFIAVVRAQADDVVRENGALLEKVSVFLKAGTAADYKKAHDIREFLQRQRDGLPSLRLIYRGSFEGRPALYQINSYFSGNTQKGTYQATYFECRKDVDCAYLNDFFEGAAGRVLQQYSFRDDAFSIYVPYIGKEGRFMLLFERDNRYGKIGS